MASDNRSSKGKETVTENASPSKRVFAIPWAGILIILAVGAAAYLWAGAQTQPPIVQPLDNTITKPVETDTTLAPLTTQLTKARYLKEVYQVNRSTYDIFEKAAEYRGETLTETKKFFFDCCGLLDEADIFSQLPPLPSDFGNVAYDLAVGELYQIGALGPEYYLQPEFYAHGEESTIANQKLMFSAWTKPQLNYWGEYGLQTIPSQQSDTLSQSGRKKFTAVLFVTNGWNIQNHVGVQFVPDAVSQRYFDITLSEERTGQPYFLLGPTFPRFDEDWATRILVEGELKGNVEPGVYTIQLNPISPPTELNNKWSSENKGLYTPYGFITPSGGYATFTITVTP